MTRGMSGLVRADLELQRITVVLDRFGGLPTVTLEGRVLTRPPGIGRASSVAISTKHLGKLGEAWIMEMRDAFAAEHPAPAKG